MIGSSDLSALRGYAEMLLPDEAIVMERMLVPDGAGGYEENWVAYDPVPCRLAAGGWRAAEEARAFQETTSSLWYITLPHDAPVEAQDRVTIGLRDFRVLLVRVVSYMLTKRVLVEEVT